VATAPVVQSPTIHPTATPNLTATALAAQAATATAQAQQTATAIAGVTATAEAHASATAGVIQTATSGKPAYQDALNNANDPANWDQNSQCVFASDGYHVKESSSLHGCKESAYTYQNAAITVDVRILSGQSGGLFFRINTDVFNEYYGYLFEIDSAGKYRISVSGNYSRGSTPLQGWTTASALKQGRNTLQVIAQDSNLMFYANGVFLVQLKDTTYNTSGVVAFLATSNGKPADVVYSNLNVYPLS
jgi:hypothetical protein